MYIRNQTSDINFEVLLTAGRCVKKRCSISCCYCHCCSGVLNQLASINDFWYYDTLFLCLFQHQCKKLYLRDKLGIQNKGTFQISFIMVNLCLGKTKFRMTSVSGLHRCKNLWYVFFASLVHAQVWLLFNGPLAFLFSFFFNVIRVFDMLLHQGWASVSYLVPDVKRTNIKLYSSSYSLL